MTFPVFASGDVLNASDMNAVGLWLVKTQTVGTGVTTVTVTSAFSTDYDNYLITYTGGVTSTGSVINLQLGSSTTGYYNILNYGATYATPTPSGIARNNGANFGWQGFGDTNYAVVETRLFQPYLTKYTAVSHSFHGTSNAGLGSGLHQVAASYTAFTLGLDAGGATFTGGTIRVYGMRN